MNVQAPFGIFVRQRRREMDLTQEELARRVGCAAITLRKIEAEDLRASIQIAERLAMALAIPLEERAEFVRRARAVMPEGGEVLPVTPPPSMEEIGREDLTGRAIRGYALAERIGMGGMGSVYRAVQPNVEREVAVKIILPAFANHPDFIRRFEAEAQLVARLEHPHIVPLYDYWREPGVAYLVMRLLRGGNVQTLLGQGPLALETTAHMLEQICSALHAAHRTGVIHRDLKPANVLLDDDQNAYLADFGLAKNLGNPDLENATQMDAIIGSPQYMSPEQIRSLSVRPQTDIYCLGVMLYEMLTGVLPFRGPTPFDLIQQHMNTPMPPLAANQAGLPAALDAVVGRATAKEPEERYVDALALFHDFREALGLVVGAGPVTVAYEEEETDIDVPNPFKGLRAFGEADADDFFGRETLVQQLLSRLGEGGELSRFLAVIGPSGSGKSSVVRAGLIPALRRGGLPGSENWFVLDMLPGKHPFEELEAALLRVAVNPPEHLLSQLKDGPRGLLRAVQRVLPADESVELVLVIDQFEEVFTLVEDEAERALLLESLATAVLDERSRLRVVLTLRADFTDKPLRYVDFGELIDRRFEFVLPLTADEVERAVAGPVQRAGLRLEKGLVSTIIREAGDQPGTLPLLQHAMAELFEKRERRTLTLKVYHEIGGVLGALGRTAEAIYDGLDEAGKAAARQLFLRLATLGEGTEDTRRRVLAAEIEALFGEEQASVGKVLDALGKARLLTFDRDPLTRGATVEVAHEALLREWGRLGEWLDESRADVRLQRQLAAAAAEWRAEGNDPSFLFTGSRLGQFAGWAATTTIALTPDERAFLEAGIAERDRREQEEQDRQQRELEAARQLAEERTRAAARLRQRAYFLAGAFALAILLAGVAAFFGNQANRNAAAAQESALTAQQNADEARQNAALAQNAQATAQAERDQANSNFARADAGRLAAEANNVLSGADTNLIALLAIRSLRSSYTPAGDLVLADLIDLPPPPREFRGHTGEINGVDISPDGRYLATGSGDKTARLWDLDTGVEMRTFTGHTGGVGQVRFSPNGKYLATTSEDATERLWDVATGETVRSFTGCAMGGGSIDFSPDGKYLLSACGSPPTAHIWDVATGETVHTLVGGTDTDFVPRAAYSPDGRHVATASREVRLFDAASGEPVREIPWDPRGSADLDFSPDGKYLAGEGKANTPVLWDVASGELIREFKGHLCDVQTVRFSPDGRYLLSASCDNTARLWDVATGETIRIFGGHGDVVWDVAFSPDGNLIATGSRDTVARVWDMQSPRIGKQMRFVGPDGFWLDQASFSPDGKRAVTAHADGVARIWDVATGQLLVPLIAHTERSIQVRIWDADFSPDGKWVLTTSADGSVRLWDAGTGKQVRSFAGLGGPVGRAIFSPDGKYVISGGVDGKSLVWDAQNGAVVATHSTDPPTIDFVAVSPDSKRLATRDPDGMVRIWDLLSPKQLMAFEADTCRVCPLAFSPDGKYLVTFGSDGSGHLWDAATGGEVRRLAGHPGATVWGIAYSPNGNYLASSADGDGIVHLWDVQTGVEMRRFSDGEGLAFSPDGKYLLITEFDGTAGIWLTDIDEAIEAVCAVLTRDFTPEEREQYEIRDDEPTCPQE